MVQELALHDALHAFPSDLGWIAILGCGRTLKALAFGHDSADAARKALDAPLVAGTRRAAWNPDLVERLKAYAAGAEDMFLDIQIESSASTPFRHHVIRACRDIPWGSTVSYGQLASQAGYPGAARAVGNCMATNRIPLVIPCHRVLAADGRLGGYSAPGGLSMKRRLLQLEGALVWA